MKDDGSITNLRLEVEKMLRRGEGAMVIPDHNGQARVFPVAPYGDSHSKEMIAAARGGFYAFRPASWEDEK